MAVANPDPYFVILDQPIMTCLGPGASSITKQAFFNSILNGRVVDADRLPEFHRFQANITAFDMQKDVAVTSSSSFLYPTNDSLKTIINEILITTDDLVGSPAKLGRYEDKIFKDSALQVQTIPCYKIKKGEKIFDGYLPLDDYFPGYNVNIFHDAGISPWNLINQSQPFVTFVQTLANPYDKGPGGKVMPAGSAKFPMAGCSITFDSDIMKLAGFRGLSVRMTFDGANYTLMITDVVNGWSLTEVRTPEGKRISTGTDYFVGNDKKNGEILKFLVSNPPEAQKYLVCKELGDLLQVLLLCFYALSLPPETIPPTIALGFSNDAVYSSRLLDFCGQSNSVGCVRQVEKIDKVHQVIMYLYKKISETDKLQRIFNAHKKDCIQNNEAIRQQLLYASFDEHIYLSTSTSKLLSEGMKRLLKQIHDAIGSAISTINAIQFNPDLITHTKNLESMTSLRALELFSIIRKSDGYMVLPKIARLFINGEASPYDPIFNLTNASRPKLDLRGLLNLGTLDTLVGGARTKNSAPPKFLVRAPPRKLPIIVPPRNFVGATPTIGERFVKEYTQQKPTMLKRDPELNARFEHTIQFNNIFDAGDIVLDVKNVLNRIIPHTEELEYTLYALEPYFFHFNIAIANEAFYRELLLIDNVTNLTLGAFYSFVVSKFPYLKACIMPDAAGNPVRVDHSQGGIIHSSFIIPCDGTNGATGHPDFFMGGGARKTKTRKNKSRKSNNRKYNRRTRRRS